MDINRTLWQASVVVGVFCCTQRVDVEVCIPDARAPVLIKFFIQSDTEAHGIHISRVGIFGSSKIINNSVFCVLAENIECTR